MGKDLYGLLRQSDQAGKDAPLAKVSRTGME